MQITENIFPKQNWWSNLSSLKTFKWNYNIGSFFQYNINVFLKFCEIIQQLIYSLKKVFKKNNANRQYCVKYVIIRFNQPFLFIY